MGESVHAYIALGSNLGARVLHLERACRALRATPGIAVVSASRIYQTEPVGPAGQGPYLNAALELRTELLPRPLLARLLEIEREQGRCRTRETRRWSARTLDLDLLLYGDICLAEKGLEIPHPRLHERAFVLEPLCELAGHRVHPRLGEPLRALLGRLPDPGGLRIWPETSPAWPHPSASPGRLQEEANT
jgi:2-amino-4-hydroxy-6-hydroxymethyldihydropteridine diphosphokinase